jgi:hypothetical protein
VSGPERERAGLRRSPARSLRSLHPVEPLASICARCAKRLFADGTIPAALRLVGSKVSTTGVVMGTYEPAVEVVTGSFYLATRTLT